MALIFRKYGNKKTYVGNIKFDSQKEANRYIKLKLMEKAGKISNLQTQVKFVIQDGFKDFTGKRVAPITYIPDFTYITKHPKYGVILHVEDVKGMKTAVYQIKRKMFLKRYPEVFFLES